MSTKATILQEPIKMQVQVPSHDPAALWALFIGFLVREVA